MGGGPRQTSRPREAGGCTGASGKEQIVSVPNKGERIEEGSLDKL